MVWQKVKTVNVDPRRHDRGHPRAPKVRHYPYSQGKDLRKRNDIVSPNRSPCLGYLAYTHTQTRSYTYVCIYLSLNNISQPSTPLPPTLRGRRHLSFDLWVRSTAVSSHTYASGPLDTRPPHGRSSFRPSGLWGFLDYEVTLRLPSFLGHLPSVRPSLKRGGSEKVSPKSSNPLRVGVTLPVHVLIWMVSLRLE